MELVRKYFYMKNKKGRGPHYKKVKTLKIFSVLRLRYFDTNAGL